VTLPEVTKHAILMMKQDNPDWGCEKISALLLRGPALPASPQAVARVLHEAVYQTEESPTRPHPDKVRHFERARPNQLWQTDLFTFVLKRQNRRVYLVAFLDDHSRFLVGYGRGRGHEQDEGQQMQHEDAMRSHGVYLLVSDTSCVSVYHEARGTRINNALAPARCCSAERAASAAELTASGARPGRRTRRIG
jgi:transposase InsO family protein